MQRSTVTVGIECGIGPIDGLAELLLEVPPPVRPPPIYVGEAVLRRETPRALHSPGLLRHLRVGGEGRRGPADITGRL